MVVWMTSSENRVLEAAAKRGFLFCRRDQRMLVDQWTSLCQDRKRPVLRVERQNQQCQVTLHWHQGLVPLTAEQQEELRAIFHDPATPPGLLPIVFRYGGYSAFLDPAAAETLARRLAGWVEEQF